MGEGLGWEVGASGAPSTVCGEYPCAGGVAEGVGGGRSVPGADGWPPPMPPAGARQTVGPTAAGSARRSQGRWGAGEGRGGLPKRPLPFPSGNTSCGRLAAICCSWLRPLALQKQPQKQPFPPCRETGKTQARGTLTHARASSAVCSPGPAAPQQRRRQGLRPAARCSPSPRSAPAPCWSLERPAPRPPASPACGFLRAAASAPQEDGALRTRGSRCCPYVPPGMGGPGLGTGLALLQVQEAG